VPDVPGVSSAVIALDRAPFSRQLLDALPLTVWSIDLEGRITSANRSWTRFASDNGAPGIASEDAVLGCSVFDSVSDSMARDQIERAMTLLRERRVPVVRWEFPCNSPTEERVFLMQVTALVRDDAVEGFVFTTVDITPSHRSREALINTGIALSEAIVLERVYEEVATQLQRAIPSTGFVIALADDDTAQLRVAHRRGFEEHAAPEALERRLLGVWLDALARGEVVLESATDTVQLTAPLVSAEGVLGAITLRASSIESAQGLEEAERVLSVIAAQTAVAIERAWLVRRVEQKRRLEAIGEVAAGVAHELRNPLFGISSAAQFLRLRAREDPMVEKNVGRILREVARLNKMASELLEFGRPNAAHLVYGDPETVWDDILEGERAQLEGKRLSLSRVRTGGARCRIDPAQLGQVFRNILLNACDAAPEGSELTLSSQVTPGGAWRSRLANGGPAIPPDVLPHVFEFFFSTKAGGSGIGLALCQRIIDEHGGTIAIDSVPEHGTMLTITLPGPAGA
jgi:PAS domain S-box-containing protein